MAIDWEGPRTLRDEEGNILVRTGESDEGRTWRPQTPQEVQAAQAAALEELKRDDPGAYYHQQGFFPNEFFNDPTERQRMSWIADKYGAKYNDLANIYAALYPGGTRETGGYRITPGQEPLGLFEWNPPDRSFFGMPGWMGPLALLGANAGLFGGAEAAGGVLGEPIGANAYFGGAGSFLPAGGGLFEAAARGAITGMINPLVAGGDLSDVVKGAAIGGISGGASRAAGQYAGGMFPDLPWLSSVARGAAAGGTGAALRGGNIVESGIVGGVTGGLSKIGQPIAPVTAPTIPEEAYNYDFDELIAQNRLAGPLASPESIAAFLETVPTAVPGTELPIGGGMLDITDPGALDFARISGNLIASTDSSAKEQSVEKVPVAEKLVEKLPVEEKPAQERQVDYGKVAKTLYSIYRSVKGADLPDVPQFERPRQKEDQSDEEYLAEISGLALDYLGLDVDILIEEGYEPNTQDVLNYIRTFVDDTIVAAFGGVDPSEIEGEPLDNLLRQLHNFSEKEIEALLRALYVRGALGVMSFQEWAADPFTGEREFIGAESAKQPDIAAAKRGHARVLESVARQTPGEARRSIKGMLGRSVDLFGLDAARKARAQDEMLAKYGAYQPIDDEEDDLYERRYGARGALPMTSRFWEQFRR